MKATWPICLATVCAAVSLVSITAVFSDEPAAAEATDSQGTTARILGTEADQAAGLPLEVARDRAIVMLDVYAATLEVLHDRYFHGDRAVVPARAMQDVFSTIRRESKIKARWISVNMKPMSIDHAPKSEFEKRAAEEISAGKAHFEAIEEGYYRRAGAIPLGNGCVGCHGGSFRAASKRPKFAGLVISVPLRKNSPVESE